MNDLRKKISSLPMCPGVYIMKDSDGNVIYVGKSKLLKNRVSQYFVNLSGHSPKTRAMVEHIDDFEYIITDTEAEALALECNLIKRHRPKYNILLKDDKQYPYIKITANETFPQIFMTRQVKKDGGVYFGPYTTSSGIREAIETLRKIFKIRSCRKPIAKTTDRPCLYYQIGQCSAPCAGIISKEDYSTSIEEMFSVLNGKYENVIKKLNEKMVEASRTLEFEKAALYRDRIQALNVLGENQKVSSTTKNDMDVIGIYKEGTNYCVQVFYYRGGKAVKAECFTFENETRDVNYIAENFVKQFYFTATKIPPEILISADFDDKETISEWLSILAGRKVTFTVPKRGKKVEIVDMVIKNAKESLYKHQLLKNKSIEKQNRILSQLCELLNLSKIPFRIESYDISNVSGVSSVGVQIVYSNAVPQKSAYRKYNIKTVDGADDYNSTREVIFRRINEAYAEEDKIKAGELESSKAKFLPLPDLILLDGGKGHVLAVKKLLETMGEDIPVFGLVKDKSHRTRGITDEYCEFSIDRRSDLFRFLAGMQDEVHRFAISAYRKKHIKSTVKSELESISGIGPATRKTLFNHFGSIENIKKAALVELQSVVSKNIAEKIFDFYHNSEEV